MKKDHNTFDQIMDSDTQQIVQDHVLAKALPPDEILQTL
jgi:hypothetical protein